MPSHPRTFAVAVFLAWAAAGPVLAQVPSAPDTSAAAVTARAAADGFENVATGGVPLTLDFENRRYRESADAIGRLSRPGMPSRLRERRLDLPVATVRLDPAGDPAGVTWPFERDAPGAGAARRERSTRGSFDLLVGPLVSYELGRIYDASEVRVEIQPQLVANPWPGGRLRASWIVPLSNDFTPTALKPDINRARPGPVTVEQYAWWPGIGLVSGTAGLLGDNRWGGSVGFARPLAQGLLLLDAQLDRTGFFAWESGGATYSSASLWTGFAGVTVRPPRLDVALRVRAARYLYGDEGFEAEMRRSMGDLDLAFFTSYSDEVRVSGVRVTLPIPPLTRPTGARVRVLPIQRFTMEYRDEATPFGIGLLETASREDLLEGLALPTLQVRGERIRSAREGRASHPSEAPEREASFTGTTGFVFTPDWRVLPDRGTEFGYGRVAAGGSWDNRGRAPNEAWYATVGFLPRTEVGLRWTVIPGVKAFEDVVPDSRLTDADRMLSARLAVVEPAGWRPGLAVGVEDASGTRRFHSTYVVAGTSGTIRALRVSLGGGYAPRALKATRHVLDGAFGAAEVALPPHARIVVEHDSEKLNAGLGVSLLGHLRLRAGWIDLRHPAVGIGWAMHL